MFRRVYNLLFKRHAKTLKRLNYGLKSVYIDKNFINHLRECPVLKHLKLININLDDDSNNIIESLTTIESLTIDIQNKKTTQLYPKFRLFELNNHLKKVCLFGVTLKDLYAASIAI